MPDLTGTKISNTYKRLMQVKSSDNAGITSSLQTIQSGDNVDSPLQLSNSILNVNGTFAIGGVNLTATVSSCLLYTSPRPRDATLSRMPSSA